MASFIMRLLEKAQLVGAVTPEPPPPGAAPPAQHLIMRQVTLGELRAAQGPGSQVQLADKLTAALAPVAPIDEVYQAAGITDPAHGWTVEYIATRAHDLEAQGQSRGEIRERLLHEMHLADVDPADIVTNLHAKDQALDAYETHLRDSLKDAHAKASADNELLATKIAALQAEMAANTTAVETLENATGDWVKQKEHQEADWEAALAYITEPTR